MRLKTRESHLTRLGEPVPVRAPKGVPEAVRLRQKWYPVEEVRDRWRVDDQWWRERAVSRMYFELLLEGGMLVTVFRDLTAESGQAWYRQNYGQPQEPETTDRGRAWAYKF